MCPNFRGEGGRGVDLVGTKFFQKLDLKASLIENLSVSITSSLSSNVIKTKKSVHLERQGCRQSFVELMLKTQWLDCEPVSVIINDIMSPLITNQNIFLTIISENIAIGTTDPK